ncbi:MAG: hypothetical protein NZ888_02850 [Candidatus Nitrosocaldus sp.]|nr:hypothetical protein [Candidatus Nitrosocaldus sp.]MDW8000071.1 hypothetical protein [Candidatus Nitrosocaldus sp.]
MEGSKDAYVIVKRIMNIPRLEPYVYSYDEYTAMQDTIERMVRDGITIFSNIS